MFERHAALFLYTVSPVHLIRGVSERVGNQELGSGKGAAIFTPFMRDVLQQCNSPDDLRQVRSIIVKYKLGSH